VSVPEDHAHQRYASGLPWTRRRALSDAEVAWVLRRAGKLRQHAALVVVLAALSVVAAWQIAELTPQAKRFGGSIGLWLGTVGLAGSIVALLRGGWVRILAGLGTLYLVGLAAVGALVPELERPHLFTKIVVASMIALGVGVLLTVATRHLLVLLRLPRLRADLQAGAVDCFEGALDSPTPELRRLARRGYRGADDGTMRLDVLPRSGLVLRAGGRRCELWIRAHLARVAMGQPHALRVRLPDGVVPSGTATRLHLQRRSLSPEERAELDDHIGRLRRRPWAAIAASSGLAVAMAWQLGRSDANGWDALRILVDPMMLGWYGLTLLTVVAYVRRSIAARKLEDDKRLRWVVTVDDGAEPDSATPPRLEVLPVSQLAWTENASPAGWRTSRL